MHVDGNKRCGINYGHRLIVTLLPAVTESWLTSLPTLVQNDSGGDSVVLDIASPSPSPSTPHPWFSIPTSTSLRRQLGVEQVQ